jgi:hypothetical protein
LPTYERYDTWRYEGGSKLNTFFFYPSGGRIPIKFTPPYTICWKFSTSFFASGQYGFGLVVRDSAEELINNIGYHIIPEYMGNMVMSGVFVLNSNIYVLNGNMCPSVFIFDWNTMNYDNTYNLNVENTIFMLREDDMGNIFYNTYDSTVMPSTLNTWKTLKTEGRLRANGIRSVCFAITSKNNLGTYVSANINYVNATI